jgi:hypothetical protein
MPTIQIEAHLSRRDLLRAAEQLDAAEFQQFVSDVLGLRARRQVPHLSAAESELLLIVNRGLPEDLQGRYRDLIAKRRQETLTAEELTELSALMSSLGLQAPHS